VVELSIDWVWIDSSAVMPDTDLVIEVYRAWLSNLSSVCTKMTICLKGGDVPECVMAHYPFLAQLADIAASIELLPSDLLSPLVIDETLFEDDDEDEQLVV
jgi:hypothetical protein